MTDDQMKVLEWVKAKTQQTPEEWQKDWRGCTERLLDILGPDLAARCNEERTDGKRGNYLGEVLDQLKDMGLAEFKDGDWKAVLPETPAVLID